MMKFILYFLNLRNFWSLVVTLALAIMVSWNTIGDPIPDSESYISGYLFLILFFAVKRELTELGLKD